MFLINSIFKRLISQGKKLNYRNPSVKGYESADPPGMSSKILSSGFSNIFIGKGNARYHRLFLVLYKGFL
jgi:hypothetical protein